MSDEKRPDVATLPALSVASVLVANDASRVVTFPEYEPPDCPGCAKLREEVAKLRLWLDEMDRGLDERILAQVVCMLERVQIIARLPAAVESVPINVTFGDRKDKP